MSRVEQGEIRKRSCLYSGEDGSLFLVTTYDATSDPIAIDNQYQNHAKTPFGRPQFLLNISQDCTGTYQVHQEEIKTHIQGRSQGRPFLSSINLICDVLLPSNAVEMCLRG